MHLVRTAIWTSMSSVFAVRQGFCFCSGYLKADVKHECEPVSEGAWWPYAQEALLTACGRGGGKQASLYWAGGLWKPDLPSGLKNGSSVRLKTDVIAMLFLGERENLDSGVLGNYWSNIMRKPCGVTAFGSGVIHTPGPVALLPSVRLGWVVEP